VNAARKKQVKRVLLQACRTMGLLAAARQMTRSGFNIVGLHGVSLEDEHRRFPTLFISPETFERRLQLLTRHYRIVALDDVLAQHAAGRVAPNQVVLTFDDGFYNFAAAAAPLLRKYGAPATVYMVTADVESDEPMYNLLLRDLVLSTTRPQVAGVPTPADGPHDVRSARGREAVVGQVLAHFYATCATPAQKMAYCRLVGEAVGVDVDAKLRGRIWDRLNAQEVAALTEEGFSLQLHTHSHHNVVEHRERVRDELRTNRRELARLTGRDPVHFCYPLGLWDKAVWDDLRAEGVQSAVTTRNGPNFPQTPALALRRYLTGEAMTDLEFEENLSGLRWLTHAVRRPGQRYEASEKRLRYKDQPELY